MKAAITEWQGRVAPLFDVAGTALVVESTPAGCSIAEQRVSLPMDCPHSKISMLEGLQVDTLICGAISRPVRECIEARGIQVYPFVSGEIDVVIEAWRQGQLEQADFAMPGCRRCRRRKGQCSGRN
jgi:predicted Fe-Mo cluster-binding NifX family protein